MNKIIDKIPLPMSGLMLGLASVGNLLSGYGNSYKLLFGSISGIIFVLLTIKITINTKSVLKELDNPVVASVFPTYFMGAMILSTYLKSISAGIAYIMWIVAIVLHISYLLYFTKKHILNYDIKKVFPSWFIVYVGVVVASVTSPAYSQQGFGKIIFWFGLISLLLLLPIVIKRINKVEIPQPAQPTIAILCAPISLLLAGYLNTSIDKNLMVVLVLLVFSQLAYVYVIINLPKLLKLKFYPSFAAFTFPLVISAISIKGATNLLKSSGYDIILLNYLAQLEEVLAVLIVVYVLFRYLIFLNAESRELKKAIN